MPANPSLRGHWLWLKKMEENGTSEPRNKRSNPIYSFVSKYFKIVECVNIIPRKVVQAFTKKIKVVPQGSQSICQTIIYINLDLCLIFHLHLSGIQWVLSKFRWQFRAPLTTRTSSHNPLSVGLVTYHHCLEIYEFFVVLSSGCHHKLQMWNPLLRTRWVQSQYCPQTKQ